MLHLTLSFLGLVALSFAVTHQDAAPTVTWESLEVDGQTLDFAVVEPADFDRTTPAPVLIAMAPGAENRDMVGAGLGLYWEQLARSGWVVISPARAEGAESFSKDEGQRVLALLDLAHQRYTIEGGAPHLAGISNGGRAAFHLAGLFPARFLSMTCLPGMPSSDPDRARLASVASLPVALFAGELDAGWVQAAKDAERDLMALGATQVELTIVPGAEHVVSTEDAGPIFETFARRRAEQQAVGQERFAIAAVLDDFHAAAAEADEARYFAHFAPGAMFVGTDATERWTLPEFRAFAAPHFQGTSAWMYTPKTRRIDVAPGLVTAWFDETLLSKDYGATRGSGVLVKRGDQWRIAQYVLSFPIPNEVASEVVERIQEHSADPAADRSDE